jgi:MFS family permease
MMPGTDTTDKDPATAVPTELPLPEEIGHRSRLAIAFRALDHRNFQYFFGGQLISLIGTWMQTIGEAWLVYRLTHSGFLLGLVAFVGRFPIFLFAPLGGIVADRFNRQRVVILTQGLSMCLASTLATLTLTHRITVWELMLLASLLGTVNAFDIPARQTFLMDMVGRTDLMNAIALNSSMFNGARILGPAVAGILVASIGEGWCFFSNAISYIAVIIGLLLMKVDPPLREETTASPIERIIEGFQFVYRTTPIFALLLLIGLVSLVAMPYTVLMPIFADKILHGNARTLGALMGATGVGAFLGAFTLALRIGLKGLSRLVAISCSTFGVGLIFFSFSRSFYLSIVLLIPVGYSMMLQMACSNTLIQSMAPDRLRGRIMSAYSMMVMGMAPLGAIYGGALAQRIGAPWTVAIGGFVSLIGAAIFWHYVPRIRAEARRLIEAQQHASETRQAITAQRGM